MKALIMTSLISVVSMASMLKAESSSDSLVATKNLTNPPRSYLIRPCNSWGYNSMANGYVCNFLEMSMYVSDARDVAVMARTIEALQAQVADLTKRVEALESR
jgi:hypothetical protein